MGECFLTNAGGGASGDWANVDLNNLSELGEARFKKGNIRYVVSDGKTDNDENLDIINPHPATVDSWSATPQYQSGTYYVTTPVTGTYSLTFIGRGANGAQGATGYASGYSYYYGRASGGSSGGFKGDITLPAGTYKVVIGGTSGRTVLDSYIYDSNDAIIMRLQAPTSGEVNSAGNPTRAGAKGKLIIPSTLPAGVSIGTNTIGGGTAPVKGEGNNGSSGYAWVNYAGNPALAGGASIYESYGKGGTSTWGAGTNGCFTLELTATGVSSPASVTYNVSEDNPLTIVDANGITSTFVGVNGDSLEGLSDGVYNKFIDESGTEFLKNNIFYQIHEPTSPSANDVWVKTVDNIEVYKYVNSNWESYNKVWLGSVELSSGGVSLKATNTYLYNNGFVRTKYLYKYRNGANWIRLYPDKWCEQGGNCTSGTAVTFYLAYADTNYTLTVSGTKSTTGFTPSQTGDWFACGYVS